MEFRKELTLKPLKMSYSDLQSFLSRIDNLLVSFNQNAKVYRKSLSLGNGSNTYSLKDDFALDAIKNAQPVSYDFNFDYYSAENAAPVNRVELSFNDVYRKVIISGTNSDNVEIMSSTIKESLEPFTFMIGGHGFRTTVGIIFWIMPILCIVFERMGGVQIPKWLSLPVIVLGIIPIFCMFKENILPGAIFYQEGSAWYEKNTALISFIALIIAAVAFLPTIEWILNKLKPLNN